ncbi:MAG TPA: hypothetical protein VF284_05945 [Rhodanobacteraceae bacterium]
MLTHLSPRRKALATLRARWGRPGDKLGYLANRYFKLVRHQAPSKWVDDKTWDDLEFPEIFARIDATVTPLGSQVLYARMRQYVDVPEALAERYAEYAELANDTTLREQIQARLWKLEYDGHAELAELLFGDRTEAPSHRFRIWAWSAASVAMLVLLALQVIPGWTWVAWLVANAVILIRVHDRQHREIDAMKRCIALIEVADKLAALQRKYPSQSHLTRLHDDTPARTAVRKSLFWLSVLRWASNPALFVPPIIVGILNLLFLLELSVHAGTIERFFRIRQRLSATFELVGGIDAAIATASFLQQHPNHCKPALTEDRLLSITEGRHPLLPQGIPNSIQLDGRSVLVTGSNMAGKTTFIKMLASNALLAQTLGFCLATAATIPDSTVMASIHGAHSVASGKSHYFAEIEAIDGFIRSAAGDRIRILAIDEPFSGTNTIERIAVARAILEALGSRAIVLVTTHDVELQAMLGGQYALFHFQENPDMDGYFDYTLRAGPATERNAIRLLDRLGFPKEITANAMAYAGHSAAQPNLSP